MMKNEIKTEECNFIKMILMILVVFEHSIVVPNNDWLKINITSNSLLKYIGSWLDSFHVYAFVLISGFIFSYLRNERERYRVFSNFIVNKAKRLLVPYITISLVWIIPINSLFFHYSLKNVIMNYLFGIDPSQLWFLLMLFGVFLLAYFIQDFAQQHQLICGAILFVVGLIGIIGHHYFLNIYQIFRVLEFLPFFFIGYFIKILRIQWSRFHVAVIFGINITLFVLYNYLSSLNGLIFIGLRCLIYYFVNISGSVLAFVFIGYIAKKFTWEKNKFVCFLMSRSMIVYLMHNQIIFVITWVFNSSISVEMLVLINFFASIFICLIISLLLFKFKLVRFLIGEK